MNSVSDFRIYHAETELENTAILRWVSSFDDEKSEVSLMVTWMEEDPFGGMQETNDRINGRAIDLSKDDVHCLVNWLNYVLLCWER